MANTLEFALGLQTGNFIKNVVGAEAVLGALKAMAEGVESVFVKMDQAIERAAGLEVLHKRTGESVGTLYKLQEAFKAVELSSDTVPIMILRVQRALSGVNEMGLSTSTTFARLGLNMVTLKTQDAATQLTAIGAALSRLPKEQATGLASQLFGRFGMGDVLQIARSGAAWREAGDEAQKFAGLYQRLAPLAEKYERTLGYAKIQWDGIWSEVALQLLPVLQQVLDKIHQLNAVKFAQNLGDAIRVIEEAFAEGKIIDLIEAGFEAAVEKMSLMISGVLGSGAFWAGIWDVMVGELKVSFATMMTMWLDMGAFIASVYEKAIQTLLEELGKVPVLGKALGLAGGTAQSFADIFKNNKSTTDWTADAMGLGDMRIAGAHQMFEGAKAIGRATVDALKNSGGPAQDAFAAMAQGLLSRRPGFSAGEVPGAGGGDGSLATSHYKPEFTSLEKMGYVLGRNNSADALRRQAVDLLQRIAYNTNPIGASTKPIALPMEIAPTTGGWHY